MHPSPQVPSPPGGTWRGAGFPVPRSRSSLGPHLRASHVCVSTPDSPPAPCPLLPASSRKLGPWSPWACFCFASSFCLISPFRFHIPGMSHDILPSLSDSLHSVWHSLGPPVFLQMALFSMTEWYSIVYMYYLIFLLVYAVGGVCSSQSRKYADKDQGVRLLLKFHGDLELGGRA